MNAAMALSAFANAKYLSLETYRRNGVAVRTPVWFATGPAVAGDPVLYVYTTSDSGKAKRLRQTDTARIAPCDARGKVTGDWISARAVIVDGAGFDQGMRLLNRKYWPWKQILDLSVLLFPRHKRIMIVIAAA